MKRIVYTQIVLLFITLIISGGLNAQQVEVVDSYHVSLTDSINTPITPEMYFNLQCVNEFNGIMYADINGLDFANKNEAVSFFQKCPYSFLNILIVFDQKIAIIRFDSEALTADQKLWMCEDWGMYFKNEIVFQREVSGYLDFRN
jgi:hypothetical protein